MALQNCSFTDKTQRMNLLWCFRRLKVSPAQLEELTLLFHAKTVNKNGKWGTLYFQKARDTYNKIDQIPGKTTNHLSQKWLIYFFV